MKKQKYMLCKYPENGFGNKANNYYLLDEYGTRYDFKDEYDRVLEEMIVVINIPNYCLSGASVSELVSDLKGLGVSIRKW